MSRDKILGGARPECMEQKRQRIDTKRIHIARPPARKDRRRDVAAVRPCVESPREARPKPLSVSDVNERRRGEAEIARPELPEMAARGPKWSPPHDASTHARAIARASPGKRCGPRSRRLTILAALDEWAGQIAGSSIAKSTVSASAPPGPAYARLGLDLDEDARALDRRVSTSAAAGRIAPRTAPCAHRTGPDAELSVTNIRVRASSDRVKPRSASAGPRLSAYDHAGTTGRCDVERSQCCCFGANA